MHLVIKMFVPSKRSKLISPAFRWSPFNCVNWGDKSGIILVYRCIFCFSIGANKSHFKIRMIAQMLMVCAESIYCKTPIDFAPNYGLLLEPSCVTNNKKIKNLFPFLDSIISQNRKFVCGNQHKNLQILCKPSTI